MYHQKLVTDKKNTLEEKICLDISRNMKHKMQKL